MGVLPEGWEMQGQAIKTWRGRESERKKQAKGKGSGPGTCKGRVRRGEVHRMRKDPKEVFWKRGYPRSDRLGNSEKKSRVQKVIVLKPGQITRGWGVG